MTSVDTKTCGTIEVWEEVAPQNGWLTLASGIYGAKGLDHDGRERTGYGKSHSEALVACMKAIEDAKMVVDRMIPHEPGTPRVPEKSKGTSLRTLPVGTVIRVRGAFSLANPQGYAGYTFEKVAYAVWCTTADEKDYPEDEIEARSPNGWDVLWSPAT